ncbi:hypothetical protein SAY86_025036 [Trapa natans]|uniref:Uncharacterized protein n=1 Tax=Trapa natans TaxID=22666 RepID=A0AAN7MR69_TRANT|nr:hypothetical protein SAY86_025036 [Trapa natans]
MKFEKVRSLGLVAEEAGDDDSGDILFLDSDHHRRILLPLIMPEKTRNSGDPKVGVSRTGKKLSIEMYTVEGLSIAGHETCVIFPAFDTPSVGFPIINLVLVVAFRDWDHFSIKPVAMYVASRGMFSFKPPTVVVPCSVKEDVERLFQVNRKMDGFELKVNLIGMDVGEEISILKDLKVRAFRTYHVIPSQCYVVYSLKQKLKQEYAGLSGNEIGGLRLSGVEVTMTAEVPKIAFTGDTMFDFIVYSANVDVLRAKILTLESTFINEKVTIEDAKEFGHTHLREIVGYADKFQNRAILLIHFSARYKLETCGIPYNAICGEFRVLNKMSAGTRTERNVSSFDDGEGMKKIEEHGTINK